MKNIVTGTDMKKVDSYTINTIGIPSLVLMESAALSRCWKQWGRWCRNLSNITFKRLQHRVVHFR